MIALDELRDAAAKAFPRDALGSSREAGWALAVEQGWLLVDLAEADGGLGLGVEAAAAIVGEIGKALPGAPLIPALLALRGIAGASGFAAGGEWIERICGGAYVPLNLVPSRIARDANGALSGVASGLFEADLAERALIGFAGGYVLAPTDARGARLEEVPLWDPSRRMFTLHLDGLRPEPDWLVAEGVAAQALHDTIARAAQVLLAADSLGGADAALTMAVDYLKVRRQFDRPLALFQALKHRCADLKTRLAAADALLWSRASAADAATLAELGALKAHACEVYGAIAEEAIQFHGGIGLTLEHPCHLFLKRAMLNAQLCGSADLHEEALGRALLASD